MKRSFVEYKSYKEQLTNKRPCDVTFVVGTEKERISCHKLFLVGQSPVFEVMFDDRWTTASGDGKVTQETGGGVKLNVITVPEFELPDVEPLIFQTFLKYVYSGGRIIRFTDISQAESILYLAEKYDVASLREKCEEFFRLKICYPGKAMSILEIADKYNFTSLFNHAAGRIANNFERCVKIPNFLQLSQENLSKIIEEDENECGEIKIFEEVHKWALNRCTELELEVTGGNLRKVLGSCLFQIRFPTMSLEQFQSVREKNILTDKEAFDVQNYIGLSSEEKNRYTEPLLFKTQPRINKPFEGIILDFPTMKAGRLVILPADELPTNESCKVWIKADTNIALHGLGFLGPIEKNAYYDVSVNIKKRTENEITLSTGNLTKSVFARQRGMLRIMFDEPIIMERTGNLCGFEEAYVIQLSVKVPPTNTEGSEIGSWTRYNTIHRGTEFLIKHLWRRIKLSEILFHKK